MNALKLALVTAVATSTFAFASSGSSGSQAPIVGNYFGSMNTHQVLFLDGQFEEELDLTQDVDVVFAADKTAEIADIPGKWKKTGKTYAAASGPSYSALVAILSGDPKAKASLKLKKLKVVLGDTVTGDVVNHVKYLQAGQKAVLHAEGKLLAQSTNT